MTSIQVELQRQALQIQAAEQRAAQVNFSVFDPLAVTVARCRRRACRTLTCIMIIRFALAIWALTNVAPGGRPDWWRDRPGDEGLVRGIAAGEATSVP